MSREEFGNMIRSLNLEMSERNIDKVFRKADKDKSGAISFSEFTATFLKSNKKNALTHEEMKEIFLEIDTEQKGYLSVPDTLKALKMLGYEIDEGPLTSILYNMDGNHDGRITLREFCVFLDIWEHA